MKLSLRAKLTGVILALAVLITGAVTVGSYTQMRDQLINTGIRNEVGATATGASALIKGMDRDAQGDRRRRREYSADGRRPAPRHRAGRQVGQVRGCLPRHARIRR